MELSEHFLNLSGVACPINFVKAKLYLDKLVSGETLVVLLDAGESVESVMQSLIAEGHAVAVLPAGDTGQYRLTVCKA